MSDASIIIKDTDETASTKQNPYYMLPDVHETLYDIIALFNVYIAMNLNQLLKWTLQAFSLYVQCKV